MKQLGRQRIARIISLAALLSCGIASTRAETVQTIDHGTINGVPTACDGTTVTISANGKQSTVPMDDILTISLRVIVPPTHSAHSGPGGRAATGHDRTTPHPPRRGRDGGR